MADSRGPSPTPVLPPGARVPIIKTEAGADAQGKGRDPNTTLGGVQKKKFSPKAPAPKPKKETPPPAPEATGSRGGGGGEGRGRGRERDGNCRGGGDRGGRGARGRGRGRGGNQPQGQVYFSGSAAAVAPPPRQARVEYGGGGGGGGGEGAGGGAGGARAPRAEGSEDMEEFDGGMLPKKTWTGEEDDGVEEEEEWVGRKQGGDDDDEDMRCDTWPPPVVNKMDPILVNFGPPTEEVRKAHEDKLARVLSDGSNLDEEEQDFIFIQLPRRMPVLDEPAPAAPPVAAPVAPPVVVKTEGAPPGTNPGEAGKPAEPEVPVRQQSENALNKMRSGYLGQMYVHASGKVTFHMGDATIYEVQPGLPCYFAQDVVSMAPDEKAFCVLGNVRKKLVCVPNLDEALPSQP